MRFKKLKNKNIQYNLEKSQLEVEKLRLEIRNLKRKPFLQPAYLSLISSFLLIIISFYTLYNSSFFDNEKTLLDLRKENLRRDIQLFTNKRDSLKNKLDSLKDSISTLNSMNDSLIKDKEKLLAKLNDKIKGQDYFEQLKEDDLDINIIKVDDHDKILTISVALSEENSFESGRYYNPKKLDFIVEITKIIEDYERHYSVDKENISLEILGYADGLNVARLRYQNEFGKIKHGNFIIDLSQLLDNRDLAFLRAYGVQQNLLKANLFKKENINIIIVEPYLGQIGAKYRTVKLKLTFRILDSMR